MRFHWKVYAVGAVLAAMSGGCTPPTVYVVERIESGVWLESTSLSLIEDAIVWEVETRLESRYHTSLNADAHLVKDRVMAAFPMEGQSFLEVIGDSSYLFPKQDGESVMELMNYPRRYGFPPLQRGDVVELENAEPVPVGLQAEDREAIRALVRAEALQEVPQFRKVIEGFAAAESKLWQDRFAIGLETRRAERENRLRLEIAALEEAHRALKVLAHQPDANPHVREDQFPFESRRKSGPTSVETFVALRNAPKGGLLSVFRSYLPQHPQVEKLVVLRTRYASLAKTGGWPTIPGRRVLRKGSRGPVVDTLRERLALEGYYEPTDGFSPEIFDAALKEALKRYQRDHFLKVSGEVDRRTRRSLNISAEERLAEVTRSIWSWAATRLGAPNEERILVNLPTFEGRLENVDDTPYVFRVTVGKNNRSRDKRRRLRYRNASPELASAIKFVVMEPKWNVPKRIFTKEILPSVEKDPDYAAKNHYVLSGEKGAYTGAFQTSGPWNVLGRVKFIFPNEESVYLHDTSAKRGFKRSYRAASHGCIRVQNALELAEKLLGREERWRKRYAKAPTNPKEQWIGLRNPMPVYIESHPVWVAEDGRPLFGVELYGRGERWKSLYSKVWSESAKSTGAGVVQDTKR